METLVFSGGGSRGFALLGAIKAIEEKNLKSDIKYLFGTSIGSLFALLFSLYNFQEIYSKVYSFSYENYQCIDIINFLDNYGLDNFTKIKQFIISLMSDLNISPNITFQEHFIKTGFTLIIDAVCLNTQSGTYFHRLSFPDMPVIRAIEASMSLPFVFPAVKYKGMYYSDGGIYNPLINLDVLSLFTEIKLDSIMCINLYQEDNMHSQTINNFGDYISQIISVISKRLAIYDKEARPKVKIVEIFENELLKLNFTDFFISDSIKDLLIDIGYKKTLDLLNKK